MKTIKAIAISTLLLLAGAGVAEAGLPLQVGFYRLTTNRTIQIAELQGRVCVQAFTSNGLYTASVETNPAAAGFYRVHGTDEVLYQQDIQTLLAGRPNTLVTYRAVENPPTALDISLQQCLGSRRDYFTSTPGVGSRNVFDGVMAHAKY